MKISILAIMLLKQLEGYSEVVYRNGGGRETIGYGHLVRAGENWSGGITREEADKLLQSDIRNAESAIDRLVSVPLTQDQRDALTIWTYNLGTTNLEKSTLLKRVNAGRYSDVPEQIMRWVHIKHKDTGVVEVSPGLVNRRTREVILWNGNQSG